MIQKIDETFTGPPPGGAYSHSIRKGNFVAIAGQCGYLSDRTLVEGLEEQTRLAIKNLQFALEGAGGTLGDVITVNVFLTDSDHFDRMNRVYAEFFETPYPARTTVFVGLRPGVLFEINALAILTETD
ncbi:MAG TPA: RidA family protein [Candidatus Paceibacterota bacterium]|nr:RidA family protein [Candidatus Paceibacterota bacterium]